MGPKIDLRKKQFFDFLLFAITLWNLKLSPYFRLLQFFVLLFSYQMYSQAVLRFAEKRI